jgi:hypothetical protein
LLQEIKRTFECLDKNKDGKLSASEFVRGSKMMHATMTKEEAKAMIKEVDANGKYKKFIAIIDRLPLQFYLSITMWHQSRLIYSQTCIKRSPLGQRKNGLIRQVTSYKRFISYEIFYDRTRKM